MNTPDRKKFPARMESLYPSMDFVSSCAARQGFSGERIVQIQLALEEVLVNIFKYAYKGGDGEAEISCSLEEGDRFVMEIVDWGTPFDMAASPDPDITLDLDERKAGGLGIFFAKHLMDDVRYRRDGGQNILSLAIMKEKKGER